MDLFMGRALTDLGEIDAAHERYLDAVYQYPRAYDSYTGLVELVEAGIPVEEYSRGLVDFYAGQYEVAIAAFDRYFAASPEVHEGAGHHYKALSLRAIGDYFGAVDEWQVLIDTHPEDPLWLEAWEQIAFTQWAYMDLYSEGRDTLTRFVEENPQHPSAPDFLFEAGEVSERMNDLTGAIELWDRLVNAYPESEPVNPSAFAAGIAQYRLGNYPEAARWFDFSLSKSIDASDRARAYLWLGKSNDAMGDAEAAQAAWEAAQLVDSFGYYGLRAGELREVGTPFQGSGSTEFSADEAASIEEVETWIRSTFQIEIEGSLWPLTEPLLSDPRRLRGEQFWKLGFEGDARAVFEDLRQAYSDDPLQTYQLIHYFLELGLYQPAIYNTRDLLALANADELGVGEVPGYLARVRFGPYYDDLILPEADRRGLEGLFVMSVARQESLFESFATSYADAKGLMQIIPSTGADLASREGWPSGYTVEDLYRPIVSVRLGTRYLADLQDYFDGDLYATLAGYNAGPGNSSIWLDLAQGDPDLFLEIIRLGQPQAYIKAIYWAYHQYQQLYTQ
jgi:soluble lytic murein transglycosylase